MSFLQKGTPPQLLMIWSLFKVLWILTQLSISPTFCEQLLHQNPFAKKLQTQIVSTEQLCKNFRMKKLLVKYWWNGNQVSIFIQGGDCLDHIVPEVRHHRPLLRYPVHFLFAEGNAEQRSPNHRSYSGENYLTGFSKKSFGFFYSFISVLGKWVT